MIPTEGFLNAHLFFKPLSKINGLTTLAAKRAIGLIQPWASFLTRRTLDLGIATHR